MTKKQSIAAVVVTRNRLNLLKECVKALREQTQSLNEIIIVDNDSSDGTAEWLKSESDLTVIRQGNTGSGGGQNTGIRIAYENGHEWIWCMDDDGLPEISALSNLLFAAGHSNYWWLNCLVVDRNDPSKLAFGIKISNRFTTSFEEVTSHSQYIAHAHPFNGTLLNRKLVYNIGLPFQELFIWGDEVEFRNRAMCHGIIPVTYTNAILYHKSPADDRIDKIKVENFWKYYYLIRNTGAVSHKGKLRFDFVKSFTLFTKLSKKLLKGSDQNTDKIQKIIILIHGLLASACNDQKIRYVK